MKLLETVFEVVARVCGIIICLAAVAFLGIYIKDHVTCVYILDRLCIVH